MSIQTSAHSSDDRNKARAGQTRALAMRIRDEERRKVAREIHDTVGQTLVVLDMNLQRLQQTLSPGSVQSRLVDDTRKLLHDITKQIRTMSYLLHPPLLDEVGLPAALREFTDGFAKRSNISTHLHIADDFGRLPSDLEITLFRIAQESLTNIHRHSGSSTAIIRLSRSRDKVTLEIQDQGKGTGSLRINFSPSTAGVGIRGMRERLSEFGGALKVRSTLAGTTVLATVPLLAHAAAAGTWRKAA